MMHFLVHTRSAALPVCISFVWIIVMLLTDAVFVVFIGRTVTVMANELVVATSRLHTGW